MMVALICPHNVALAGIEKGKYSGEYFPFFFFEQLTHKSITRSKLMQNKLISS